jgi:hypothetical protein
MGTVRISLLALICLSALILFPIDCRLYAQNTSSHAEEHYFWANIGGGGCWVHGGLGEDEGGVSGGISLSYQKGSNLFSIRYVDNEEFKLDLFGYSGPPDAVWDVGVLYGRAAKASYGLASISAGLGLVGMSHNDISSYRLGIPIEGQLFFTPVSILGLGISSFANINSKKSFLGALLCLQIGRLR